MARGAKPTRCPNGLAVAGITCATSMLITNAVFAGPPPKNTGWEPELVQSPKPKVELTGNHQLQTLHVQPFPPLAAVCDRRPRSHQLHTLNHQPNPRPVSISTSAAPSTPSCTCSTPGSGTNCSSTSATLAHLSLFSNSSTRASFSAKTARRCPRPV